MGYDLQPFKDWRLKAEAYYQSLYNVPVNTFSSSYSMLNTGASFKTDLEDNLTNAGQKWGRTHYQSFSTKDCTLLTINKRKDGVEHKRLSMANVFNLLAGKEWAVGNRNKFSLDFKYTNAGGRAHTPIDLTASNAAEREVLSTDAYSAFYDNYFRMDLKLGYTINSAKRKLSQTVSLDIQNITNHKNVFSQSYNGGSKSIQTTYQLGLFPNVVYKVQF